MSVQTYKAASMFLGENWCAKCPDCGTVLTKYCHDEVEARRKMDRERKIPPAMREQIELRDEGICQICGSLIKQGVATDIDHILPLARGGRTNLGNLQLAHASCNRRKGARV